MFAQTVRSELVGLLLCVGMGVLDAGGESTPQAMLDNPTFMEDFEMGSKGIYAAGEVVCTEGTWLLDDALLGGSASDKKNGLKSARVRMGSLAMQFDKTNGVGTISLYHGMYGSESAEGVTWTLSVSKDGGATWSAYVSTNLTPETTWQPVRFDQINVPGPVRVRIDRTDADADVRINFDDLAMDDYIAPYMTAIPPILANFTARLGAPSAPQPVVVSAGNLTSSVVVTAPSGFEISRLPGLDYAAMVELPPTNGSVAATTLHVRLTGAALGGISGQLAMASTGAEPVYVAVAGTVVDNLPPILSGLPAVTNATERQAIQLHMLATDSDGAVTNLTVSSPGIPDAAAGMSVLPEGNALRGCWTWTPGAPGTYTVTFTVTDNEGEVAAVTVTITVDQEWIIAVVPGQTVFETFDDLAGALTAAAGLPTGWKAEKRTSVRAIGTFAEAGTATERIGGNGLSASAGNGIYNFGAGEANSATDRAVGFLSSSGDTRSGNLMVQLENGGSELIAGFNVAYAIEKYRAGTNTAGFVIQLLASDDGVNWHEAAPSMRTYFPPDLVTQGYDSAPGQTVVVTGSLDGLQPGASLYLAWNYSVAEGSYTAYGQALAIDDVVIQALAPPQTLLIVR